MLNVPSEHPKKIIQKKNLNMNSLSCIKPRKLLKMISSIEIFLKLLWHEITFRTFLAPQKKRIGR